MINLLLHVVKSAVYKHCMKVSIMSFSSQDL